MEIEVPELRGLGSHLLLARAERGLSQAELANRCALTQTQISYFELGRRPPTLSQFLRIARALDVPIQRLLSGSDRPRGGLEDLAVELRRLGINDLWVQGATVPGAFRRPEEVLALAVSGHEPDPRVIEAVPAALAWNEINATLLRAHGIVTKTILRLAWLADVALAIERQKGFPGGCRKEPLERFLRGVEAVHRRHPRATWDGLGKPTPTPPASPLWKRWMINYDASLDGFEARARHLVDLRDRPAGRPRTRRVNVGVVIAPGRGRRAVVASKPEPRRAGKRAATTPEGAAVTEPAGVVREPGREDGGGR